MFPNNSIFLVYFDYIWIFICIFIILCELDTAIYLWHKDKKSSMFLHHKNENFLQKVNPLDLKKWKYKPFFAYIVVFMLIGDWFDFRYYFPDIYAILIALLVFHSIVFVKVWMREKKEEKNNTIPPEPKEEKDIELIHK